MSILLSDIDGPIATLTINPPDKRNAMSDARPAQRLKPRASA